MLLQVGLPLCLVPDVHDLIVDTIYANCNSGEWQLYSGISLKQALLYQDAHGRYLVHGRGGVDFHWTHRINVRAAGFEFQDRPQFASGNMTPLNVNTGPSARNFS